MNEHEKRIAEANAEYYRDLGRMRNNERRVIGPGGGPSRRFLRGDDTTEIASNHSNYVQSQLREMAKARGVDVDNLR